MKSSKILINFIFLVISLILFSNLSFSIGVYELNGNYVYYTNSTKPTINMNITSPAENIILKNASFKISTILIPQSINYNNQILKAGNSINLDFISTNNISQNSINAFNLLAIGQNDGKKIIPFGDPVNFLVKLDIIKPDLVTKLSTNYKISGIGEQFVQLNFDEEILSYKLSINNVEIENYKNPSNFKKNFKKYFKLNFSSTQLKEGNNKIRLEFSDLAQNTNSIEFNIFYRGLPLEINLQTNRDDPNLKYFYDKNYSDFFKKTIYSSVKSYDLVLKTSKVSNCYLSTTLSGFNLFENVLVETRTKFTSSDGLKHNISVNVGDNIWVACQNPVFADDIAYLNNALNIDNLIELKLDNKQKLKFDRTFPNRELTSNIFNIIMDTNKRAVCFYKLDSQLELNVASSNYLNHNQNNIPINDGNHNINFRCFDDLGTKIIKNQPFNVDSKLGVKIYGNFPFYTLNQIDTINFSISEDVICKYSTNPNEKSINFNNLTTNISGNAFTRYFTTNTLVRGNNTYYILCDKNKNIIKNKINIVYDPDGPSLSNLTFINNGIASNFVGSLSKIHFKFDVNSLTPIKNYFIEFIKNNESIFFRSTTNDVSLNFNLSGILNIKIIAENLLNKNSSPIDKKLLFDLNPPEVKILMKGNKFKITCFDVETGCLKIEYGLSRTNLDCIVNTPYSINNSIEIKNYKYVCVKAQDGAQNNVELIKPLVSGFNLLDSNKIFDFNNSNETTTNDTNLTTTNDEFFTNSNFPTDKNKSSNNLLIAAAIFILLAGVSGGGYYAYNKGYLNEQLKKLGIKNLPTQTKNSSNKNFLNNQKVFGRNKNQIKQSKKVKKSSYDEHLNKLNKFIDDKINSSNDIFDKFSDDKHKGQVKGYDDTLIKKNKLNSKLSKEEFDEFYSSSKKLNENSIQNLEKDSEAFEKYYKEKKQESKIKKTKK